MDALMFLFTILGVPFLMFIVILAVGSWAAKPVLRASRDREIERDLRRDVADMDATQRAAQKILRERG